MSSSESEPDVVSHSASLKRLQSSDPEFYKFLKENDQKLLNFEGSDDEQDSDQEIEGEDNEGGESEAESEAPCEEIEDLREELQNNPSVVACRKVMSALKNSVARTADGQQLNVVNASRFNDIMKLCLVDLLPALSKVLKLNLHAEVDPSTSKRWKRLSMSVKSYLIDILKIIGMIGETTTLELLLKHVKNCVPFFALFMKLARILAKKLINIWSTSSEKARVLAYITVFRIMKRLPEEYHSQILKQMYFAYIRNTKFTTPTLLPLVTFMKKSLSEMYGTYNDIAYEHCFLYLRQLGIHLRNALITKKKESFQTVYNWQYIHCLSLWAEVISKLYHFEPIKTLMYPLVQLVTGTINLIPTLKYIPLRFHLIKVLIHISSTTKTFIPVPPLILESLNMVDFNKKSTFTKKPINLLYALKASKSQLQESGYKDTIIAEVCNCLLDYFTAYSSSISFPELSFLAVHQIKGFLKKNKVAKYGQQLKAVVDKLQQNSNQVSLRRNNIGFSITDVEKVKIWEDNLLKEGLPLSASNKRSSEVKIISEPPKKKKRIN